jgi:hypothetical protein
VHLLLQLRVLWLLVELLMKCRLTHGDAERWWQTGLKRRRETKG